MGTNGKQRRAPHRFVNLCADDDCVQMCKNCFKFAAWHVDHKFNILALLQTQRPEVPHDAWKMIEEYTWSSARFSLNSKK